VSYLPGLTAATACSARSRWRAHRNPTRTGRRISVACSDRVPAELGLTSAADLGRYLQGARRCRGPGAGVQLPIPLAVARSSAAAGLQFSFDNVERCANATRWSGRTSAGR